MFKVSSNTQIVHFGLHFSKRKLEQSQRRQMDERVSRNLDSQAFTRAIAIGQSASALRVMSLSLYAITAKQNKGSFVTYMRRLEYSGSIPAHVLEPMNGLLRLWSEFHHPLTAKQDCCWRPMAPWQGTKPQNHPRASSRYRGGLVLQTQPGPKPQRWDPLSKGNV